MIASKWGAVVKSAGPNDKWDEAQMPPWYPLLGNFDVTTDDKNRLLVPSNFRRKLEQHGDGEQLILVPMGESGWLYPAKYHLELARNMHSTSTPSLTQQRFFRAYFGLSSEMPLDKQGRILLTPKNISELKLTRDLTLVGAGDKIEIWNRTSWAPERTELLPMVPNLMETMSGANLKQT